MPTGLLVSNPVSAAVFASASVINGSPAADDSIAYVSLTPGTAPTGSHAIVRRVGSASDFTTPVFDGGFDPVPLVARTGDSIEVVITDDFGGIVQRMGLVVAATRRPIVVRTQPPPRKRDVPLNAAVVVVFSEPISNGSLSSGAIRLMRGSSSVAGTTRFLDPSFGTGNISVEFVPDASLAAGATYKLVVSPSIRDLTGDALVAPDTVEFTTVQSLTGPPATLSLSIDSAVVLKRGTTLQLTATVFDSAGHELTDHPVTWSVDDTTVASVTFTGLVRSVAPGITLLSASAGQATDRLWIIASELQLFVTIDPPGASIDVGKSLLLTATVRDSAGKPIPDAGITRWSVSDPSIGRILTFDSHSAQLYGSQSGTIIVTATAGPTQIGSARITIVSHLASLTLSPDSLMITIGSVRGLTATLKDSAGGDLIGYQLAWVSDNPSVAALRSFGVPGVVTAVGTGSATISVTSEGITAKAHVDVVPVTFASVRAGASHTCAVTVDAAAYCWGSNFYAQLGIGQRDTFTLFSLIPVAVVGDHRFSTVTTSSPHPYSFGSAPGFTCGVTTAGIAYCWGENDAGELGRDHISSMELWPDSVMAGASGSLRFSHVSAGDTYTCGLTVQNAAYCWGGNPSGPLGPIAVPGGLSFATLSAGGGQTCGMTTDGTAYCWGLNDRGQLGDSTTTNRMAPVTVWGGLSFAQLSAGAGHTCGVTISGAAYCWGANDNGQLGDNTTISRTTPTAVHGGLSFTSVSAGQRHTCGVTSDGSAYCWGRNSYGQLGDGTHGDGVTSGLVWRVQPVPVLGGLSFARVSAGGEHTCGITTASVLYCWGVGGAVGDGTNQMRTTPVKVLGQP